MKRLKKGNLNLVDLGPLDETNAAIWKSVWAQVSLQEMPPKKKSQPDIIERLRFSDWVVNELQVQMKDKGGFQAHLDPNKATFFPMTYCLDLCQKASSWHLHHPLPVFGDHSSGTHHSP